MELTDDGSLTFGIRWTFALLKDDETKSITFEGRRGVYKGFQID